ncbi:MAG TPA: ATP-binding cassette domain-containing protein, partial [Inquilinus sp.]|nr:ATP-binding cassette domain-containing protein [Inquilinus sp.]
MTGLAGTLDAPKADAAADGALLSVRDLTVSFETGQGPFTAVRSLGFDLAPGRTLAIVGESGSGKSVTALSIMRLVESVNGRIEGGSIRFRPDDGVPIDLARASD